jgi:hypothetical protein
VKKLLFLLFSICWSSYLLAQCECNNCIYPIPIVGVGTSTLTVPAATFNVLGQNNQRLRAVRMRFPHNSISEISLKLIAPNGSQVTLIEYINAAGFTQGSRWEICFVDCAEDANPAPGFPAVFSNLGWGTFTVYTGSYYPSIGCLSDLTGNVAGTWTLEWEDFRWPLGGFLWEWFLEFEDNSGTTCSYSCVVPSNITCEANGGEITPFTTTACEGSSELNLDISVFFPGGAADPNFYDYYYIITDENGVVLDILPTADLTTFLPGTYNVCGLSILAEDFPLLPTPNGSRTIADIQTDIDNNLYCAELSLNCRQVVIVPNDENPEISGPDTVCVNQLAIFTLEGLDPQFWTTGNVQGPFTLLNISVPTIEVVWGPGPNTREICFSYNSPCGSGSVCKVVTILDAPLLGFTGTTLVCPGDPYIYFLDPPGNWNITIEGGTLLNQTNDNITVEWFVNNGINRISGVFLGECAPPDPIVLNIGVIDVELPTIINNPDTICLNQQGESSVSFDPNILNYNWSVSGVTIISGQGSNSIQYTANSVGTAEVCIEVETLCGAIGPVCSEIEIVDGDNLSAPEVSGPFEVCAGVQVNYVIENYDPALNYIVSIVQGAFSQFQRTDDVVSVTFISGPAILCFSTTNECGGTEEECITIEVLNNTFDFTINGHLQVCPDDIATYTLNPGAPAGTAWQINIIGGVLIAQSGDSFEVQFQENGGNNSVQVTLTGGLCGDSDPLTLSVDLINFTLPGSLNSPTSLCLNDEGTSNVVADPVITAYVWSISGGTILSGQGSNSITYSVDVVGVAEVCLELMTDCGALGPLCELINVVEIPQPSIEEPSLDCGFEFTLTGQSEPGSAVSWQVISGPAGLVFSDPNSSVTQVTVDEAGTYMIRFLENNGTCDGFADLEVNILELLNAVEFSVECVEEEYRLELLISGGTAPYFVDGEEIAGNLYLTAFIESGVPYTFNITDANGCAYTISGVVDCGTPCTKNAGTMDADLIGICISSGNPAVGVHNANATLGANDIGQYVLHTGAGAALGTIIAINDTGIFDFQAGILPGVTYYISFIVGTEIGGMVDLNDECLSVAIGQPVIWEEDPVFVLNTESRICGGIIAISVDLVNPNDEVTWSVINFPGGNPPVLSAFTGTQIEVEVSTFGTYSFQIEVSNGICIRTSDFEIDFIEEPNPLDLLTECLSAEEYVVSFSVQSDWIISIPGSIDEGVFTSDPLPSGTTTLINIVNPEGCEVQFNVGPIACDCTADAGTMSLDTLFICETEGFITLNFNNDAIIGPLDTSLFVIHTLSGTVLGVPVFFTDQLSFPIPTELELETLYFVSNLVTSIDSQGNPDLNDPCLSLSAGQPLYIYRNPSFDLPQDTSFCFGPSSIALLNTNNGTFSILSDNTGLSFSFENASGILSLSPTSPGNANLSYMETNGTCTRADTLELSFWEVPRVESVETNCDGEFYVLELRITGGLGPYQVNGTQVTNNLFVSDLIPSNTPFTYSITDQRGCTSEATTVNQDCECETEAGQISNPLLILCDQANIDLSGINLTGTNVPAGYELYYFLTDNPIWNPANILVTATGAIIPWMSSLAPETTYYVFAVVAGRDAEGNPDFSLTCLSSSNVLPVLWREGVQVSITGTVDVCVGIEQNIRIQAVGTLPATVILRNNLGEEVEVTLSSANTDLLYPINGPGQIVWEVSSVSSFCGGTGTGSFTINAVEEDVIEVNEPNELCNRAEFGAVINLNSLLTRAIEGVWTIRGVPIVNGFFDADGLAPGIYDVQFSTIGFTLPCPGSSMTIQIEVIDCECPQLNFPDTLGFCSTEGLIFLDELLDIRLVGEWSISRLSGNGAQAVIVNGQININQLEGLYRLIYTLSDAFPDHCPLADTVMLNVEAVLSAGTSSFDNIVCAIGEDFIDLDELLIGADTGGRWLNELGDTVTNRVNRSVLRPGANLFTYEIEGDFCPMVQSFTALILADSLLFETSIIQALCPEEESGVIVEILSSASDPNVLINGVQRGVGSFFILSPGVSTVQIGDGQGCFSKVEVVQIIAPQGVNSTLIADVTLSADAQISVRLSTNVADEDIASIIWLANGVVVQSGGKTLELMLNEDQKVQVFIETIQGCTGVAEINLNARRAPVFIPSAFFPGSALAPNQRFGPISPNGITSIESFQIFDRWGNKVWDIGKKEELTEAVFWDGTFRGQQAMEGVYVYKLVYINNRNQSETAFGEVTLLR